MGRNRVKAFLGRAADPATCASAGLGLVPAGWVQNPWQQRLYQLAYEQAREEVAREVRHQRLYQSCSN